jgi:hypothetical protein
MMGVQTGKERLVGAIPLEVLEKSWRLARRMLGCCQESAGLWAAQEGRGVLM